MEEPEMEEPEMEEAETEEAETEEPGTSGTQVSSSPSGPLVQVSPQLSLAPPPPYTPQPGSSFSPTDLGWLPL